MVPALEIAQTAIKASTKETAALTNAVEELSPQLIGKLDMLATQIRGLVAKPEGAYIEFDAIPNITNSILEAGKLKGSGIEINNAIIGSGFEITGPSRITGTELAPVKIGTGVSNFKAEAGVHIGNGSTIGYNVRIGENTSLEGRNLIGSDVHIGPNASIGSRSFAADRTRIEEGARIGTKAKLFNDVVIGQRAIVARGATIGGHSRLGPDVIVGADSKVNSFVNLLDGTKVAHHAKVEANVTASKSFIGPYSEIGSGSVLNRAQIGESFKVPRASSIERLKLSATKI